MALKGSVDVAEDEIVDRGVDVAQIVFGEVDQRSADGGVGVAFCAGITSGFTRVA